MIRSNDRVNGEFYVDQALSHALSLGLNIEIFEIDKYLCWGTPKDYETYQKTIKYWQQFVKSESWTNE